MLTLFGIPNCDTVKKARRWLEQNQVEYVFHDFRQDGIDTALLERWLKKIDWTRILNQRSRTWRELSDSDKTNLSPDKAIRIMLRNPSIIKRPVLATGNKLAIGFDENEYRKLLT